MKLSYALIQKLRWYCGAGAIVCVFLAVLYSAIYFLLKGVVPLFFGLIACALLICIWALDELKSNPFPDGE